MPKDVIDLAPPVERAFLIAVDTGDDAGWTAEDSLAELASLADTAGADVVGAEWQNRRHIDPNWYLGKGKAQELVAAKAETGLTLLIADDELKPMQQKALEELLGVKVLDRSGLILDIFAQHARTHEGRLQVELAQLEYQLPRLTRLWTHLSRTQGGIGSRGPGESQLETDRRLGRTDVWANYRDESFILQFLSPRLIRRLRMFHLHDDPGESAGIRILIGIYRSPANKGCGLSWNPSGGSSGHR